MIFQSLENTVFRAVTHVRQVIHSKFNSNTKPVYGDFKGSSITANETPTKNEVEQFWNSIWEKQTKFNNNAKWLKELQKKCCKDVTPKIYKIDRPTVDKVINNMSLNKSPGKDLIIALRRQTDWLSFTKTPTMAKRPFQPGKWSKDNTYCKKRAH